MIVLTLQASVAQDFNPDRVTAARLQRYFLIIVRPGQIRDAFGYFIASEIFPLDQFKWIAQLSGHEDLDTGDSRTYLEMLFPRRIAAVDERRLGYCNGAKDSGHHISRIKGTLFNRKKTFGNYSHAVWAEVS